MEGPLDLKDSDSYATATVLHQVVGQNLQLQGSEVCLWGFWGMHVAARGPVGHRQSAVVGFTNPLLANLLLAMQIGVH